MKTEQIFAKAMEKAVTNGYRTEDVERCECETCVIFSHDFAKAFYGERMAFCTSGHEYRYAPNAICRCGADEEGRAWLHHLQRMVLEEEPVKYLEKFLE